MRSRAIWRWLLPVMAVTLLLAACRPSPQPPAERGDLDVLLEHPQITQADPDRIVLHLLSFHTGQEFEFWKWLGEQYTREHPNVEIQVDFISSDDYFTDSKLLASFASGHGPDVFFVSPGTIRRFENAGILEPLTAEFTPEIRRDFNDAALESVTLGGQIYAVPFETELLGLYYNEAMFREKGIRPPSTWAELEKAAQVLKSAGCQRADDGKRSKAFIKISPGSLFCGRPGRIWCPKTGGPRDWMLPAPTRCSGFSAV
ncbi:hypothetical protein HMSSN139_10530 [Paenibacillus sp. HMSSN-139]|nr:hypothetical protein HMSSN139_10530 [Paenibacillus sp. HMSSN-139]